jgi:DNA-binding NarL/FixJ family response regulator
VDGPPSAVRVVLADDDVALRLGVRAALEASGMDVCAEAADSAGALQATREQRPDVALMDVRMDPPAMLAVIATLRVELPQTTVIVLTAGTDPADLMRALQAGARGYLLKDTDPDRLPAAILGALRGEAAIPRTLVAAMVDAIAGMGPTDRVGPLSDRETDVMAALARGLPTAGIAQVLGLTEVTVRRHLSAAAGKLGASGRDEALERFRALDGPRTE